MLYTNNNHVYLNEILFKLCKKSLLEVILSKKKFAIITLVFILLLSGYDVIGDPVLVLLCLLSFDRRRKA